MQVLTGCLTDKGIYIWRTGILTPFTCYRNVERMCNTNCALFGEDVNANNVTICRESMNYTFRLHDLRLITMERADKVSFLTSCQELLNKLMPAKGCTCHFCNLEYHTVNCLTKLIDLGLEYKPEIIIKKGELGCVQATANSLLTINSYEGSPCALCNTTVGHENFCLKPTIDKFLTEDCKRKLELMLVEMM